MPARWLCHPLPYPLAPAPSPPGCAPDASASGTHTARGSPSPPAPPRTLSRQGGAKLVDHPLYEKPKLRTKMRSIIPRLLGLCCILVFVMVVRAQRDAPYARPRTRRPRRVRAAIAVTSVCVPRAWLLCACARVHA